MRCINRLFFPGALLLLGIWLGGCAGTQLDLPYDSQNGISAIGAADNDASRLDAFAADLCIADEDVTAGEEIEEGEDSYGAAVLFDVNHKEVLYSRNANAALYPASMTKVMTAICAMKYGNKDDVYVATDSVLDMEEGAVLCGIKPGDSITLDQAMHGLLICSGNDAAIVIAEGISGSVDSFCQLMNQEALELGASNTHFDNPNGLHMENHITSPYDMYLIFQEAVKYDWFNEIIAQPEYTTTLKDSEGNEREVTWNTTDHYVNGSQEAPGNVTVIGGKTGTTSAAGNNLILLSKDSGGNPYISVVMKAQDKDTLYHKMNSLLQLIP